MAARSIHDDYDIYPSSFTNVPDYVPDWSFHVSRPLSNTYSAPKQVPQCNEIIAEEVIRSFAKTNFIVKNRRNAVLYFGGSGGEVKDVISSMTKEDTKWISPDNLPIGYTDIKDRNIAHYDFSTFGEALHISREIDLIKRELASGFAMKMIVDNYAKALAILVVSFSDLHDKRDSVIIDVISRVSYLIEQNSTNYWGLSMVITGLPTKSSNNYKKNVINYLLQLASKSEKYTKLIRKIVQNGLLDLNSIQNYVVDAFKTGNFQSLSDFSFAYSNLTQQYLLCLRNEMISSFCMETENVNREQIYYFQESIDNDHSNLIQLKQKLVDWNNSVGSFSIKLDDYIRELDIFRNFLFQLQQFFGSNKKIGQLLKPMLDKYTLMEFAELLRGNSITNGGTSFESCRKNFIEIKEFLRNWLTWIDYLQNVDITLRKDLSLYAQLKTINVNSVNPREVLEILKVKCGSVDFNPLANELKIKILFELITGHLTRRNNFQCEEDEKLIVSGSIIQLSEIQSYLMNNRSLCVRRIKEIQVYATESFVIESDFYSDKLSQVSIFAPIWNVTSSTVISLQGKNGKPHAHTTALNGTTPGGNGADGLPGMYGDHGAHFLGISQVFNINGTLTIRTNGGNGASGQNGGHGMNGRQSSRRTYFITERKRLLNYFYYVHFDHKISYTCKTAPLKFKKMCPVNEYDNYYQMLCLNEDCEKCQSDTSVIYSNREDPFQDDWWIYAQKIELPRDLVATSGGNGGKGGVVGVEGRAGRVLVSDWNGFEPTAFYAISENGTTGSIGKGGKGGRAGKKHDKLLCHYYKEYARYKGDWLNAGQDGVDNTGVDGWVEQPAQAPFTIIPYIEKYKYELRKDLNRLFNTVDILSLIEHIEDSNLVKQYYTMEDYVEAFISLEKQYFTPDRNINVRKFYEFLYNAVNKLDLMKHEKEGQELLTFLKTALYCKLIAIKRLKPENIIIDFTNHFKLLTNSIIAQRDSNEILLIHQDKTTFIKALQEKISQAESIVRSQVSIGIDGNIQNIHTQINNFLQEMDKAEVKLEQESFLLQIQEKNLENTIKWNMILGVIKTISTVLSLLGSIGAVASGVMARVSEITSSQLQGDAVEDIELSVAYTRVVSNLGSIYTEIAAQKVNLVKDKIETLKNNLKAEPEAQSLLNKIKNIEEKAKEDEQPGNLDEELKEIIASSQKDEEASSNSKVEKAINQFNNAVTVAEASADLYHLYKNNDKQLEQLKKKINQTDENIQKIKQAKKNIEKNVGIMLNVIHKDFKSGEKDLKNKERVELDIRKWNIQNYLLQIKTVLRQLTGVIDNKNIQENVSFYIDKLEMTMNTMIHIYDRIEGFKEQMQMVDFITAVNTAKSELAYISDLKFRHQAEELMGVIKTNALIWQYNNFIEQLKQAVFPYAKDYMHSLNPLLDQQITKYDVNKITAIYINKITELNLKLQSVNLEIESNEDPNIINALFTSDLVSSRPFFIWSKANHRLTINRLLRGESVHLYADITKSTPGYNAIKLKTVQLNFRTDKQSSETTLNALLNQFRIYMTHTGDSYYRCQNDFYLISTGSQKIIFSYQKRPNSDLPVEFNNVYSYLKKGDNVLSPYTDWKIQLVPLVPDAFEQLRDFRDLIDLELSGTGTFVIDQEICQNLEDYYKDYTVGNQFGDGMVTPLRFNELLELNQYFLAESVVEKYVSLKLPYNVKMVDSNNKGNKFRNTRSIKQKLNLPSITSNQNYNCSNKMLLTNAQDPYFQFSNVQNYDMNSTLLLINLIHHKLTNRKFKDYSKNNSYPGWLTGDLFDLSTAMNITDAIENIIEYFVSDQENLEFDPVNVQSTLVKMIKNYTPVVDVNAFILQTVKVNIPEQYHPYLNSVLVNEGILMNPDEIND